MQLSTVMILSITVPDPDENSTHLYSMCKIKKCVDVFCSDSTNATNTVRVTNSCCCELHRSLTTKLLQIFKVFLQRVKNTKLFFLVCAHW